MRSCGSVVLRQARVVARRTQLTKSRRPARTWTYSYLLEQLRSTKANVPWKTSRALTTPKKRRGPLQGVSACASDSKKLLSKKEFKNRIGCDTYAKSGCKPCDTTVRGFQLAPCTSKVRQAADECRLSRPSTPGP